MPPPLRWLSAFEPGELSFVYCFHERFGHYAAFISLRHYAGHCFQLSRISYCFSPLRLYWHYLYWCHYISFSRQPLSSVYHITPPFLHSHELLFHFIIFIINISFVDTRRLHCLVDVTAIRHCFSIFAVIIFVTPLFLSYVISSSFIE